MVGSYQNPGRDDSAQTTNSPWLINGDSSNNGSGGITESNTAKNKRVKNKIRKRLILICVMFLLACFSTGIYLISSKNNELNQQEKMYTEQLDLLNSKETTAESGCQSTVILMRHCEKIGTITTDTEGDRHCSLPGLQRAQFLPSLFIDDAEKKETTARWPVPSYLYALGTSRQHHLNYREIETLQPLATTANLSIDSRFGVGDGPYLADEIYDQLVDGSLCGKTTLICWKHSDIPELARALGCGTRNGCPKIYPKHSFDQVWLINFFYDARDQYETLIEEEKEKVMEVMDDGKNATRYLKRKKRKKEWSIYGYVTEFGFDPLHHSKQQGIYK